MSAHSEPEIIFYDLACTKGVCFSMMSWRSRLHLNYKGIPYKTVFLEYSDIASTLEEIGFKSNISTMPYTVPAIHHIPTNTRVMGCPAITTFLESFQPSLASSGDLGQRIEKQTRDALGPVLKYCIPPREILILNPQSAEVFRQQREAAFGCKLEEVLVEGKEEQLWGEAIPQLEQLSRLLNSSPFISGAIPCTSDFFVVSALQSARTVHEDSFTRMIAVDALKAHYEACEQWMSRKD